MVAYGYDSFLVAFSTVVNGPICRVTRRLLLSQRARISRQSIYTLDSVVSISFRSSVASTVLITRRRAVIHNVTVGSHSADFVHGDPLASLSVSNQDVHNHPELKRKLYSALQEGDEGELSIAIPKEVSLRQSGNRAISGLISEGAMASPTNYHICAHYDIQPPPPSLRLRATLHNKPHPYQNSRQSS